MTLKDGSVVEERQGHIRGGVQEPLTRTELEDKFKLNARFGGWNDAQMTAFLKSASGYFDGRLDLTALRG